MSPYSAKSLSNLKKSLQEKEAFLPFEFLGRSLAYNPYVPRARLEDFKRESPNLPFKALIVSPSADISLLSLDSMQGVGVDFTSIYELEVPSMDMLDTLTHLRRYTQGFVIHFDRFISPYQLLESAIYGSDCVVLEAGVLQDELANMQDFALRLGLLPIVKVCNAKEIKTAIFAKTQAMYLEEDFLELLPLVPNSKIIFRDLPMGQKHSDEQNLNEEIAYGVDVFFIRHQG